MQVQANLLEPAKAAANGHTRVRKPGEPLRFFKLHERDEAGREVVRFVWQESIREMRHRMREKPEGHAYHRLWKSHDITAERAARVVNWHNTRRKVQELDGLRAKWQQELDELETVAVQMDRDLVAAGAQQMENIRQAREHYQKYRHNEQSIRHMVQEWQALSNQLAQPFEIGGISHGQEKWFNQTVLISGAEGTLRHTSLRSEYLSLYSYGARLAAQVNGLLQGDLGQVDRLGQQLVEAGAALQRPQVFQSYADAAQFWNGQGLGREAIEQQLQQAKETEVNAGKGLLEPMPKTILAAAGGLRNLAALLPEYTQYLQAESDINRLLEAYRQRAGARNRMDEIAAHIAKAQRHCLEQLRHYHVAMEKVRPMQEKIDGLQSQVGPTQQMRATLRQRLPRLQARLERLMLMRDQSWDQIKRTEAQPVLAADRRPEEIWRRENSPALYAYGNGKPVQQPVGAQELIRAPKRIFFEAVQEAFPEFVGLHSDQLRFLERVLGRLADAYLSSHEAVDQNALQRFFNSSRAVHEFGSIYRIAIADRKNQRMIVYWGKRPCILKIDDKETTDDFLDLLHDNQGRVESELEKAEREGRRDLFLVLRSAPNGTARPDLD